MARAAGAGAKKIGTLLKRRATLLACCALLAWISNWSVHAGMALERPLGVQGAICSSVPAHGSSAPCPICENALAAGAGPLTVPVAFACLAAPDQDPPLIRPREALAREALADALARAPPRA